MPELDMSAKKVDRFKMPPLSEFYEDLLRVDAFLARNTLSAQAKSLLQAFLTQKEPKMRERVQYLADKRGITFAEMWQQIQLGKVQEMSNEELAEIQDDGNDEDKEQD